MALQQNTAEGMPHGTPIDAGQTGSGTPFAGIDNSGTVTAIYSNTQAAHGTQSYRMTADATSLFRVRFADAGSATSAALRFYVYFEVFPSVTMSIAQVTNTLGTQVTNLAYSGGRFIVQNASGTIATFPTLLATGQWYRLELQTIVGATTSDGTIHAAYYLLDSPTPVDAAFSTTTTDVGTADIFRLTIGKRTSAPSADIYLDDIGFNLGSSTPLGPYVPPANVVPTAHAGPDQTAVEPWSTVTLDGSGSTDSDGTITAYDWTQTTGPAVTLSSSSVVSPTFVAPAALTDQTFTFQLIVTDNQSTTSSPDTVDITVLAASERAVMGGQEVPLKLESVNQ